MQKGPLPFGQERLAIAPTELVGVAQPGQSRIVETAS